ncbi:MAG: hypothetical protein HFJ26_01690 [Clostridia bacterium]|nr:hypothetical protein [Clostridia bacterium]
MLDYNDLTDNEKRNLRNALSVERIHQFYLEDNNILIMEAKELFEYIYILDIKKLNDAVNLIDRILEINITTEDTNKNVMEKLLESKANVYKLSNEHYAYKEN